jgi:hypothetical protein
VLYHVYPKVSALLAAAATTTVTSLIELLGPLMVYYNDYVEYKKTHQCLSGLASALDLSIILELLD